MTKSAKKKLEQIKKLLEREKKSTLEQIKSISAGDPFADPERIIDNAASDTDAKEEVDHDRIEALKNELNQKIHRIDYALQLLDKGEYGECQRCGRNIDIGRLKIMPAANLCVKCEKEREGR